MPRKRNRLIVISDEEESEEEEEHISRRVSPRKRRSFGYYEHHDDEDEEDEEDEEEEHEEDHEQPGPSTTSNHNQRTQEEKLLPVTCGNKKGDLDVEKLRRGEDCIKCQGHWYSGPGFEILGGKGSSKKWKATIFHENKPLQFLFEQGSLPMKRFNSSGTETIKQKKILPSNRTSESPTKDSEIQSVEESQEDDVSDQDWLPGSEELTLEREEGEEERAVSENGREVVDSGADKSKEEENEMEDEDTADVADNGKDNSVSGSETKSIISASEEIQQRAMQNIIKVIIKRLPEFQAKTYCQSNSMEHPAAESAKDATTSGHKGAGLMKLETGVPQITQVPGSTVSSDMEEGPSSRPSSSSDLDTVDLDQLKREKIKMQLKVLKLQEEYYTLKIKQHKK